MSSRKQIRSSSKKKNSIFVVHGHNESLLHAIARLITTLGLEPIILREQPDQGRAIIEKFEQESADASFAIVLMTADDVGCSQAEWIAQDKEALKARARQNVILELGYFAAKLGRNRVCVLYTNGVELPSDIVGVLYIPYDSHGAWKLSVARELKAAGFEIDLNKLF